MSSSLTEDYLRWLAPQIRDAEDGLSHPDREFWGLILLMFDVEFYELVPNDRNRIEDGLVLRIEFCHHRHISTNALDDLGPGRFLEVLIALSRRLAFNAGGTNAPGWAWILLSNLNLHRMADPLSRAKVKKAENIIDRCIRRAYSPDGSGGFFPLEQPHEDQREVEIWYQMSAYISEMEGR